MPRPFTVGLGLVAVLAVSSMASPAHAQPAAETEAITAESVAVPSIQGLDAFPAADRGRLNRRLRDGLSRSGFRLGNSNDADAIVKTRITKVSGDYQVAADFEQGGQVQFSVEDTCELCGVDELGETLASLGSRLQRRAAQLGDTARLKVESSPPGAEVRLDGELVGTTPLDTEVPPGSYEMTVEQTGYRSESKSVSLDAATQAEYSLGLKRQGYKRWLPWTLLGTGIVAVAAGGSLLAIDEEPIRSDCNPDIDGRCQFLYDTSVGGIALTVVGSALVISGVTLAVLWRRNRKASDLSQRLQPRPGGLAVPF